MDDLSNYDKLRADALRYYHTIKPMQCPALGERVHFPAESFNHIIFKNARSERDRSSQIMRFKLLPKAVHLVEVSTVYQEFEETLKQHEVKIRKKRVTKTRRTRYWGLIGIIDGRKIKVILRKVGDNGQLHFWSVIPAWITNRYRDTKFVSTMKGAPEED